MVVHHVLRYLFKALGIDLVCLIAEDELLVIVGILHGSLHRRYLGVSFRDRFDNVLLLVGIVRSCIGCIKLKEI